jgi:hypothetical protein
MRMKAWHKLFLVSLAVVMVFGTSVVMASTGSNTIEVVFQDLKLVVRGAAVNSPDEPFIYNGRTYVPLRTVAEALGEEVKYDGDTKTVYVGKIPVGDTYLSDVEPFDTQANLFVDQYGPTEPFTMGGKRYTQKGIGFRGYGSEVSYNLNGKYKSLTAKIGLNDATEHRAEPATIQMYSDVDKIFELKLIPGELPKDVTIDVKSALRLKIVVKYDGSASGYGSRVNLVNAILHP